MRLPNLLAHRHGRAAAFFLLYLTEGIPQGFATILVATHLRRIGIGPAEIGATLGLILVPWAFKWAYGPLIDVLGLGRIGRLGRRRGWVLFTQSMMALTLLALPLLELPSQLSLFAGVLFVHNLFCAMQDVAVDGLACNSLKENERAFASGLMFAGQNVGMLVGGSGALFLSGWIGFQPVALFAAAVIALITVFVVLPMREEVMPPAQDSPQQGLASAGREIRRFAVEAFTAFLGSRRAFGGLLFGLLPIAAMSLSLSLQSSLAVDLGLSNDEVAWLGTWSAVLTAVSCVLGGMLSDRIDRRRALAVYIVLISLPVLYLMQALQAHGWIMPSSGRQAPAALVQAFWAATLAYHLAFGLIYGARAALFMDVTRPAVAATQFAAFMALTNLSIAYSSVWQGIAVEQWGYPQTLLVDALFGLSSVIFLPMMGKAGVLDSDVQTSQRARRVALVLGLLCLAWPLLNHQGALLGAGLKIFTLLFTVIFVVSALFLFAATALLPRGPLARTLPFMALALLLMHARHYLPSSAAILFDLIPLLAGATLLLLARQSWTELNAATPEPIPA